MRGPVAAQFESRIVMLGPLRVCAAARGTDPCTCRSHTRRASGLIGSMFVPRVRVPPHGTDAVSTAGVHKLQKHARSTRARSAPQRPGPWVPQRWPRPAHRPHHYVITTTTTNTSPSAPTTTRTTTPSTRTTTATAAWTTPPPPLRQAPPCASADSGKVGTHTTTHNRYAKDNTPHTHTHRNIVNTSATTPQPRPQGAQTQP